MRLHLYRGFITIPKKKKTYFMIYLYFVVFIFLFFAFIYYIFNP